MNTRIRPSLPEDEPIILEIVNAAAEAYRGVIPADRWHDPYMGAEELRREIAAGVAFSVCELDGEPVGVMGIQPVGNVELVRHAYVRPDRQGSGIGRELMAHLRKRTSRQVLVGTWAAATWAIRFYEKNGFKLVDDDAKALLLKTYWSIPERQIETSVVLASPVVTRERAQQLVAARGQ